MSRLVEKVVLPILGEMYIANADEASLETTQALQEAFKKLYEYEEAEEQGLLFRLPCKVGDTVYRICPKCSDSHNGSCQGCAWENTYSQRGCWVYGGDVDNNAKRQIVPYKVSWGYIPNLMENIGKIVFLTREEAEQKLQEMAAGDETSRK